MAWRVAALDSRTRSIAARVLAIELSSRASELKGLGESLIGMTHPPNGSHKRLTCPDHTDQFDG